MAVGKIWLCTIKCTCRLERVKFFQNSTSYMCQKVKIAKNNAPESKKTKGFVATSQPSFMIHIVNYYANQHYVERDHNLRPSDNTNFKRAWNPSFCPTSSFS
ncbi:hypothetical protein AVEN_2843-1 [Araneus ventricosus]|uniref:Uncharacterized protein n=1 Tax=Araneus ventricosus TaxID=182803 RepID=A0A4Y2DST1_ARAVE|nr:hypothetical protein AVEN_2843-1 [Araneus ventricosus]